jgi:hypothetical protein
MLRNVLQALWGEPRPDRPPVRVWRDWALLGVLLAWSVLEALFREDLLLLLLPIIQGKSALFIGLVWRPVAVVVTVAVLLTLLWRRTHPFATVVAAFGILTAFDVVRILATIENGLLWSIAGVLVLPYSLFRWGSGREAGTGLGVILAWLVVTHIADPIKAGEVVAGFGFFLFSAALGASIRFHANARARDIEQAKLRQRHQLARELHDVVGHYVSAIAIQAQAGRAMVGSEPARAATALKTIEETASHALKEMRVMSVSCVKGASRTSPPRRGWVTSRAWPVRRMAGRWWLCNFPTMSINLDPPWELLSIASLRSQSRTPSDMLETRPESPSMSLSRGKRCGSSFAMTVNRPRKVLLVTA